MKFCCEEGKQYTDGRCWIHNHREVTFIGSATKYANEDFIDEKAFYEKEMKTKEINWD